MKPSTIRFVFALLIALFVATGAFGPVFAQNTSQSKFEKVRLVMQDGWTTAGRHAAADDFVLVCPTKEVLDPSHPCSDSNSAAKFDDLVLVCPNKEVLDPSHPCAQRRAQVLGATPDDYVLVCPIKEVLDPSHPCAQRHSSPAKFKIPNNYVLTCPVKEVLEPSHPCAQRPY